MSIAQRGSHVVLLVLAALPRGALGADPLNCTARVDNFGVVRVEGLAELMGDLVLECTGGTPTPAGQPLPTIDFDIELNTEISSRILDGEALEALLLVDDPTPPNQIPGKSLFQAERVEGNRIRWRGVLFNPPGSGRTRTLRFKNIRADASAFDSEPRGQGNIILRLLATGILEEPLGLVEQKVAVTQDSLAFQLGDAAGTRVSSPVRLFRSHDNNEALFADPSAEFSTPGGRSFTVRFEEQLPTAFRRRVATNLLGSIQPQADPASASLTETGFFNPDLPEGGGLHRAGLSDHGTRLMANFRNVPAGVAVFVTIGPVRPGSTRFVDAELVSSDVDGANTESSTQRTLPTSIADRGIAPVPIVDGQGQAVWEITSADAGALDEVSFGVTLAYLRDGPELGTAVVSGSYAPASEVNSSSLEAPLPRFRRVRATLQAFEISLGDACGVAVRDIVLGGLDDPLKDDLLALDAVAGTLLDLQVKSRSAVGPLELRLFDPSLAEIEIGPFLKVRGRAAKLKGFPLFDTGEYLILLRSPDGSPADYRLQVRGKLPKEKLKLRTVTALSAPGEVFIQELEAVAGSVLNATLKGKGADPEIIDLVDPTRDATVPLNFLLLPGTKREKLKGLLLPLTGTYLLRFSGAPTLPANGASAAASLDLSIRIKGPGRRVLEECLE